MSTGQQLPRRHHYIPEFYLKRWADGSGRLVQFSKPWNDLVKPKRVYPKETGFVNHLYELKGVGIDNPSRLEQEYFSPIDSRAADVLAKIERGDWGFTEKERTAWGQFLLALVTRHPNHVRSTRDYVHKFMNSISPEEERRWAKRRREGDARTMRDALQSLSMRDFMDREALRLMATFSQNEKYGTHIINMKWATRKMPYDVPALLTSDRPLQWFGALAQENCHILLPLGPKRIFWACNTEIMMAQIRSVPLPALVDFMNKAVARRAVSYVYSLGDGKGEFIQEFMGVDPEEQPMDRFAKILG